MYLLIFQAPAKPNKPTVEGIDVDRVRVDYKFGLGGGYTHEFLVMYRKKGMSTLWFRGTRCSYADQLTNRDWN